MLEPQHLQIPSPEGGAPVAWRAFGQAADIDLDFGASDRPALVTAVLASCRQPPQGPFEAREEEAWRLSVAARIGGLIAIYAQTRETDAMPLVLWCPRLGCGEALETALPLADLLALARAAEAEPTLALEPTTGVRAVLRRPRGEDQRRWRDVAAIDQTSLKRAILRSLVVEGETEVDEAIDAAAAAMGEFDPLVAFEIALTCPACGNDIDMPVDLVELLLGELARAQALLIADIHRLAGRYGWREQEILTIPRRRRARYLRLIATEDARAEGWGP